MVETIPRPTTPAWPWTTVPWPAPLRWATGWPAAVRRPCIAAADAAGKAAPPTDQVRHVGHLATPRSDKRKHAKRRRMMSRPDENPNMTRSDFLRLAAFGAGGLGLTA